MMNWQPPTTYPERTYATSDWSCEVLIALAQGGYCVGFYDYWLKDWRDQDNSPHDITAWCYIDPLPDALATEPLHRVDKGGD
jgi:hypothetical protein